MRFGPHGMRGSPGSIEVYGIGHKFCSDQERPM